ncbi:MAG: VOC family protein [Planctomycetota bacterium]
MAGKVRSIPEGARSVTPHLIVKGGAKALQFYKKAFGAEELFHIPGGPDMIAHAEMKIGDSQIYLCDEYPQMGAVSPASLGGSPVTIHLYVENVDAAFKRATDAGAKVRMPLTNMFWGDRYGKLEDPFGHVWSLATHVEDVSPEECAKRAAAAMGGKC